MMYTFITYTIRFSSSHNMICSLLATTLIPCSIILQTLLTNPFIPLVATLVRCTLLTYTGKKWLSKCPWTKTTNTTWKLTSVNTQHNQRKHVCIIKSKVTIGVHMDSLPIIWFSPLLIAHIDSQVPFIRLKSCPVWVLNLP